MKSFLVRVATVILSVFCHVPRIHSQVLSTGETGGRGSQSLMISGNAIQPNDFGRLFNFWLQYGRGVSDRVDAFAGYGNITVFGRSQSYLALGSGIGVLRRARAGVDVLLYNGASIPLTHRQQASRVLLGSAVIASRPIKAGTRTVTPYGGVYRQTPISSPADSIFTPPTAVFSGIVGMSIPVGRALTFFVEFNPGRAQRSGGTGVMYVLPSKIVGDASR